MPSVGSEATAKREINRKIARARDLGSDINRIVGTSLDKGVEMDALAKLDAAERARYALSLTPGPPCTLSPSARNTTPAVSRAVRIAAMLLRIGTRRPFSN